MRILIALVLTALVSITILVSPNVAGIPDCVDYTGIPRPLSAVPWDAEYRSLVAVGGDLCTIVNNHRLQGWQLDPDGLPQRGGLFESVDGRYHGQLAVHEDRVYAATGC